VGLGQPIESAAEIRRLPGLLVFVNGVCGGLVCLGIVCQGRAFPGPLCEVANSGRDVRSLRIIRILAGTHFNMGLVGIPSLEQGLMVGSQFTVREGTLPVGSDDLRVPCFPG